MSDKRKIAVNTIEMAAIIAALNEYGVAPLGESLHDRFMAADPANDGPEVNILKWRQRFADADAHPPKTL